MTRQHPYRSAGAAQVRTESAARCPGGLAGLLFDKDGTLFDFDATWGEWCRDFIAGLADGDAARAGALAAALEFDLAAGRFRKSSPVIAGTLEAVVEAVLRVMPGIGAPALRAHISRESASVRPVEAAPLAPLLDRLRRAGLALGVATNDGEAPTRAQLGGIGVLERFDFVAGYDSGFGAKPAPGMQEAFLRAVGLAPGAVAMIGDSTHDLAAGRAAGMVAVAVLTGPAEAADLAPHADAVLTDIGELPDWLELGTD